jgi:PAS domain S-box-containing protein
LNQENAMQNDLNLLLQNVTEGLILLDGDGVILFMNKQAAAITGFTEDELLKKHLSAIYRDADDLIKAEYELSMTRANGTFVSEDVRTRGDGSTYWGRFSYARIGDKDQKAQGFTCVVSDVSARKEEEITLRQSEEKYRMLVEGVKDYAIFMLDPKGYIMTWNQGAQNTKGYAASEIIGKHFSTFYTAEDLQNDKPGRELRIAAETGKYEEEGWRVKKNGSVFWANVVLTALFNQQNKLIGYSKVTRDLSDRKEKQEMLRQSEERYRMLVEQVTDYAIFMLDEQGRIISWNKGAERIKGYAPNEVIGKYFSIFYSDEDNLNGKPAMELKVARKTGKYEEEGWRKRKDGSRFWANVVITSVYNKRGEIMGFSKVTRDLTERKRAERELKESHDRYRMLADELKIINEELRYTNQELEQFTSVASHDLQEPLRTIKSFLQLIEMKLPKTAGEDLQPYLKKCADAAQRMRELIQNLLQYSQLSRGVIMNEKVNVEELINQAIQNLKGAVEKTSAVISVKSDVDFVEGDKVQLLQLIQNLLSNALKFTSASNPQVRIRCNQENEHVKFSVADNGIGIARSDIEKVFDIFKRLHTEKEYPGTGIGLAICKKIVERHMGNIWVESEPGKGTTFFFTLNEKENQKQLVA